MISMQLAEAAKEDIPAAKLKEILPKSYLGFQDVFCKESFDELPEQKQWDHAIDLKPESQPFSSKVYPMSPIKQKEHDDFLKENLSSGHLHPLKSPMASPVFFVMKKDGKLRFFQDYQNLNAMTVKNTYPLPLVPDIINQISDSKARYFTKLDVHWGYNNVRIKEGDKWKATFQTNRGLFKPLVMFFSLTNSPATFQTMMNDIFKDLIDKGYVAVNMDDILVYTRMIKHHREVVTRVLDILRKHQLYLKAETCTFECTTVEYLGLVLSEGQVEMDPGKITGVRD